MRQLLKALAVAGLGLVAAGAAAGTPGPDAEAAKRRGAPVVEHMVVFRDGTHRARRTSTRGVIVRVGRRRCASATGTPLAALVRARPARRIGLRDFGSCSRRARDGAGLFVRRIGGDANRGNNGWVYKVGRKQATAGAGDPSGPFGRGRLRRGRRVTWFYCKANAEGECQRSLGLRVSAPGAGLVSVRVIAYDDEGKGVPAAGARVRLGGLGALANAEGLASFTAAPGRYGIRATRAGNVRTYPQRVTVR
ncbi:MAG: hypothetical protein M3433_07745 [Actinomycetota bacterium]|nr:hypothetical protein [Actinomycetota bacterium]